MNQQVFPTKGNLISTKKSLELSSMGFELLDRKRNILIREMMAYVDKAKMLRREVGRLYHEAYLALQQANVTLGVISNLTEAVPVEDGLEISFRSVMGVEIPTLTHTENDHGLCYGLFRTNSYLDHAYQCFDKVKQMTVVLAEVESSVCRLANAIRKTQRRANALRNVVIPRFEDTTKFITDSLEEKEREEFSRLKVIKSTKEKLLDEVNKMPPVM